MNKKKIKFSIIIVSLNTKDDFLKTLNSVIKQDYKLFEVIVVDGKSTDGTLEIIKRNKNIAWKKESFFKNSNKRVFGIIYNA